MTYCFDTDVVSSTLRRDVPPNIVRRMAIVPQDEQATTAITVAELVYGAIKRADPELTERVGRFIRSGIRQLPFDSAAAEVFAAVRVQLEREGRHLAEPDLRIAAIALSRDLTLVTGNVRHFERVPGLRVENWLETGS